jgi:hypothetical protein
VAISFYKTPEVKNNNQPLINRYNIEDLKQLTSALVVANRTDILSKEIRSIAEQSYVWTGGIPPMRFDEFAVALDGCPLYPRQYKVFYDTGY